MPLSGLSVCGPKQDTPRLLQLSPADLPGALVVRQATRGGIARQAPEKEGRVATEAFRLPGQRHGIFTAETTLLILLTVTLQCLFVLDNAALLLLLPPTVPLLDMLSQRAAEGSCDDRFFSVELGSGTTPPPLFQR